MHREAKLAFTEKVQSKILETAGIQSVVDLGGFESHILEGVQQGRPVIVRATHIVHRDRDLVQAELEWLSWLGDQGAAVCGVALLPDGDLCVQVDDFVVSMLIKAPGHAVSEQDWSTSLFERWGKVIGRLHQLSLDYRAQGHQRFCLTEDDNLNFPTRIPTDQHQVQAVAKTEMAWLKGLPRDSNCYGLIHCDAHPGNFFVDDSGAFTLFDFDDCCYGWFGYDVATILLSAVLQPWVESTDAARVTMAKTFISAFLEGYITEADAGGLRMADMPRFLKLRELSLYGVYHTFFGGDHVMDWSHHKFMAERQARIERQQPFLEMDFSGFS